MSRGPDLFPDTTHGSCPLASTNAYHNPKIEAYGERTLPVILGTDGAIREKTKRHPEERGRYPRSWRAIFVMEHQGPGPRGDQIAATDARPETTGAH